MTIYDVKLISNRIKRLVILCSMITLTVACEQAEKSSSNNDSQDLSKDLTVQPGNPNNNQNIAGIPQKTPGEITVNQPSTLPNPTASTKPQTTPSASPNSIARVPQNQTQLPQTQSSPQSNNSISKALTDKFSPQATSQPNIPKPQTQTQPIPAKPVVQALRDAAKNPARKIAAASNTNVYRSRRLGVNFKYPKGFVIKEPESVSNSSKILELWSLKDYQAVAKGSSKNTHSSGNVIISLEDNPQGLSLAQWVTNNDELGYIIPESYGVKIVAGKEAMSFRTEGLYEFQNIVLPSSDGKKIILISFAQGDKSYQKVFDQVVASLQVN